MSSAAAAAKIYPVDLVTPGPLDVIAKALNARLQLAMPLTRFHYEFVPSKVTEATWKTLLRRTPFIGLGWSALVDPKATGRLFDGQSRWELYLVTKNPSSIGARYFGDAQGPGLFSMVHAAVALLHGFVIPGFGSAQVRMAGNAYAETWDDDLALAIVTLDVGTTVPLPEVVTAPGDLTLFETMFATWNVDGVDGAPQQLTVGDRETEND